MPDDVTPFTPNLAPRWDFLFNDDATTLSAPGDGFLYLNERWLQQFFPGYATVSASETLGGRAVVVSGEWFSFLRLNDGSRICEKRFDERNFSGVSPAFDPTSGAAYAFDSEARVVYKVSANCREVWRYLAGISVAGFETNSTRLFGAGGSTVFALDL